MITGGIEWGNGVRNDVANCMPDLHSSIDTEVIRSLITDHCTAKCGIHGSTKCNNDN